MNKQVAILFEKIMINDNSFVFIPINCIEGEEKNMVFITDSDIVYEHIKDVSALYTSSQYFYGYSTTIDEIKKYFQTTSKREALSKFLEYFDENIVLGNIDKHDEINIINFNFEKIMNDNNEELKIKEDVDEFNNYIKEIKKEIDSNNYEVALSEIKLLQCKLEKNKLYINNYDEAVNKLKLMQNKVLKNIDDLKTNSATNTIYINKNRLNVKKIIENVNKNVIDQREAVDAITTTIAINHMTTNSRNHSNILVTGPTGVGKTEILNSIAKEIEIPCVVADMGSITQEGYVGKSVDSLIAKIYKAANGDLNLAQRGILALDEIDKKASQKNDDVAGRAVLNSLLKILDGNVVDVNIGTSQSPKYIAFDTSHLTIVSIGAFADLNKNVKNSVGFGINKTEQKVNSKESYFEYGIPEEFMGRMGVVVNLHELTFDNYINILYKSCNSPLLIKKQLLQELGVTLKANKSYIEEVARKTPELKAGVRGLKIIINESLQPALTKIIKEGTYSELLVDSETVNDPKKYILK